MGHRTATNQGPAIAETGGQEHHTSAVLEGQPNGESKEDFVGSSVQQKRVSLDKGGEHLAVDTDQSGNSNRAPGTRKDFLRAVDVADGASIFFNKRRS